jgi:hypothetical protein
MIQRFHADARVSFALLLRKSSHSPIEHPHPDEPISHPISRVQLNIGRGSPNETTCCRCSSNGRYSVLIHAEAPQPVAGIMPRWEADTTLMLRNWLTFKTESGADGQRYQPTAITPTTKRSLFIPIKPSFIVVITTLR